MAVSSYVAQIDPAKRPPLRSERAAFVPARKVAILGFGTVGRAVAELLCRNPMPDLRLTHVFNRAVERKRVSWTGEGVSWTERFDDVLASDADVVVELIGGVEPAHEYIRRALLSGKSVVTANKHVMAKHGVELLSLARETGQRLEYGASVGGGVPILPALQYGLAGDRLFRAVGVLNGTCNYILSNMEARGTSLSSALAKAQQLGYAEADPTEDVNGMDAACKLAIVARLGLRADMDPFDVPRQSIEKVGPADFRYAKELGCTIRQLSYAELNGDQITAAVGPALVPLNSPLAATRENQNAVVISGENSGETLLAGRGAGGPPTAVAVVSDLLAINLGTATDGCPSARSGAGSSLRLRKHPLVCDLVAPHYVRLNARKQATVEALAAVFARHRIRIRTSLSKGKSEAVLVTAKCQSATMREAIAEFQRDHSLSKPPVVLPMLS